VVVYDCAFPTRRNGTSYRLPTFKQGAIALVNTFVANLGTIAHCWTGGDRLLPPAVINGKAASSRALAVSVFGCIFPFRRWANLFADSKFKTAEWSYVESAMGHVQLSFGNDEVRK